MPTDQPESDHGSSRSPDDSPTEPTENAAPDRSTFADQTESVSSQQATRGTTPEQLPGASDLDTTAVPPAGDGDDQVTVSTRSAGAGGARSQPAGLPIGRPPAQLSKFRIDAEIGRGGFGVVYRAFDTQLNRTVALKVPRDTLDGNTKQRFFREAQATAALDHAGLVPIFEAGETDDGICFIATAFCDGPNLHRWLQQNKTVPCRTAAAFVRDLAEAMQHAHNRGVVHRDLKPANVMTVAAQNSKQTAGINLRITDFGLARLYGEHLQETNSSYFWGTPNYMAPELLTGSPDAETQPATDIYSLGVILYEILTGQRPFNIKHPLELLNATQRSTAPLPRSLNADVPMDLETICLKCISPDAEDRYASCADMAADLSSFLAGRPIQGRRPGVWDWLRRWAGRSERTYETGLLSVALGIGVPIWIALIIAFVSGEGLNADIQQELIPQTLAVTIGLLMPLAFIGAKVISGGRRWIRAGFVLSIINVVMVCPPLFGYVFVFPNLYARYPLGKIIAYTALTASFSFQVLQYTLLLCARRRHG
ncbi:MAG: serine/threonine protein kinase [Planctomycetaceae bacterium]|nr:serine/threonine protein kinase [Planctomycetaceae bacterium]